AHVKALEIIVSGKVTDQENGEELPGVNILEKGTSNGTVTDIDGNYSINVNETATLVVSFIGYTKQEIALEGRNIINISLAPDIESLDEIIVVGYGVQRRSDLTGSVSSVKA